MGRPINTPAFWLFLALPFLLPAQVPQTLVFRHVNVVNVRPTGDPLRRNQTVTIQAGRIISISDTPADSPANPAPDPNAPAPEPVADAVRTIDATGKFIIPGLWDMHVHLTDTRVNFPLFLANGITGIREMYSAFPIAQLRQLRLAPDAPRVAIPAFLDSPDVVQPEWPDAAGVRTAQQAKAAAFALAQRGPDFLKVYGTLSREAYFAIADTAKQIGMPFAGHVPEAVSPLEAAEAGQRSQEHLNGILIAASSNEEQLRARQVALLSDRSVTAAERVRLLAWPSGEGLFDTYSEEKAAKLFAGFVKNGTWQTPTLTVLSGFVRERDPDFLDDPRRKFVPQAWWKTWDPANTSYLRDLSPEQYQQVHARMAALLDRYKKLVGDMNKAGVPLLAGTDLNRFNPVLPGWGLHEELALLVDSGLTPQQALQTATLNPARYFNIADQMGTVETGKVADLVILNANPLEDIRNTQKIDSVVSRGQLFSRQDLDAQLERARVIGETLR
jgi:imidazolonepropionase-like amidohydrolase